MTPETPAAATAAVMHIACVSAASAVVHLTNVVDVSQSIILRSTFHCSIDFNIRLKFNLFKLAFHILSFFSFIYFLNLIVYHS